MGSQALFQFTLGRATTSSQDDSLAPLWAALRVRKGFVRNLITVFFLNLCSLVLFLPFQPGGPLPRRLPRAPLAWSSPHHLSGHSSLMTPHLVMPF